MSDKLEELSQIYSLLTPQLEDIKGMVRALVNSTNEIDKRTAVLGNKIESLEDIMVGIKSKIHEESNCKKVNKMENDLKWYRIFIILLAFMFALILGAVNFKDALAIILKGLL